MNWGCKLNENTLNSLLLFPPPLGIRFNNRQALAQKSKICNQFHSIPCSHNRLGHLQRVLEQWQWVAAARQYHPSPLAPLYLLLCCSPLLLLEAA